jgi:phosphoribosylglycinamide formyltransferase-1
LTGERLDSPRLRQPVVVLISGRGSNMRALAENHAAAPYRVALVLSDKPDAAGLAVARDLGIPTRAVAADKLGERAAYDRTLATAIDEYAPALIVLAGFMRILSAAFVERYDGRILNIHPSLLPRFPGLHTHRRALEAGEAEHGATVHFVTAQLDCGPPIIQARVRIEPGDDEARLAARVQAQEHRIYPLAVRWFCEGRLRYREGRAWLDGKALEQPVQYDDVRSTRLSGAAHD